MARKLLYTGLAIAMVLAAPLRSQAVSIHGVARSVPYLIGFHPLSSSAHPYVGQMHLTFNHGIISGTYTDISTKPGSPFANAYNIPVTGGVSGSDVTMHIRQVTFRGTVKGEKMRGSATIRGSIYTFAAQQGTPGSGR
jgi:hypothetical protein